MEIKEKEKLFIVMKNYKRLASNLLSEISSYDSWSDDFSVDQIKKLYSKLIHEFKGVDFTQFTFEELKTLDFQLWDNNVILMPIWAVDCLTDGSKICSMDGEDIIFDKSKGLDKDTRFGCTSYGFNISQLRQSTLDNILN